MHACMRAYMYIYNPSSPLTAQLEMRTSSYRLGLRPGSVRLRSRALDLRFSRALAAGLVPRPPPGLSPRAHSRGRAPTPCASAPNWADLAEMPRVYSLLEKIFVVLLLLRGDVSVLLSAREVFGVPEKFVVLAAVESRVPLGLLDPHGVGPPRPCLLRSLATYLVDRTAGCCSWAEIRVRVLQQRAAKTVYEYFWYL